MPDNTDIYGFTYPCPGEVVTGAAIALLANQIDVKANDVNNDWFDMLNRRNSGDVPGALQNIAAGVETVLVSPTYVFPIAGVWMVGAEVTSQSSPATITAFRGRLRLNATARFGITMNTENNILAGPRPAVPMVAVAGDTASITVLYNGTGTMNVIGRLSAKLLCRIA